MPDLPETRPVFLRLVASPATDQTDRLLTRLADLAGLHCGLGGQALHAVTSLKRDQDGDKLVLQLELRTPAPVGFGFLETADGAPITEMVIRP